MARRNGPSRRRWFGADIVWRLDEGIEEWARWRREPGSGRSKPRDLDEIIGHERSWWQRIRSGQRRVESGLNLGEIQEICDIIGVEPEEIVGRPSPLWALRGVAAEARRAQSNAEKKRGKKPKPKPKPRRGESLLDAALRLRREGDIASAAVFLVRELERKETSEALVHASYLLGSVGRLRGAISAASQGYLLSSLEADGRGQGRCLLALAFAYHHAGSYEKAEAAYGAALLQKRELLPVDLCSLYQCRGRNLRVLGRVEEAGVALGQALEYAETPGQRAFMWWLQGDLHREVGQSTAALVAYQQALELSTGARPEVSAVDRAHLLSLVGVAAYESGQDDIGRYLLPEALRLLSELATTAPEAQAVLAAAHGAAARGERAAAWNKAEKALASIRKKFGGRSEHRA